MKRKILDKIDKDFHENDQSAVIDCLSTIELDDVRMAILTLAKGNVDSVASLTESAIKDYRDVLMWAEMGEDKIKAEFERNMLSIIKMAERGWVDAFDSEGFIELVKANASAVKDPGKMIERIKRIKPGE